MRLAVLVLSCLLVAAVIGWAAKSPKVWSVITGHIATAPVPYARDRTLPLVVLLICSQLQDCLIPVDIIASSQRNFGLLEMKWSHDIVPALVLALASAGRPMF